MQCQQAQELFSDHLAGQLDPALNVSLENHERSCAKCRAELAGMRRVWSELDALPSVEPPAFFHDNLMHRIRIEQDKLDEAAQRKRFSWNWRALFQPRSPVFAVGLLLLALLGMGGLHAQRASLDPIGAILRLLNPATKAPNALPALQSARAEWHPNGQGGGTLTVYVQAQTGVDVSVNALNYSVAGRKRVVPQNDQALPAAHETTLSIPLDARPSSDITLTLSASGDTKATVPVTLMEPVSAPTDAH